VRGTVREQGKTQKTVVPYLTTVATTTTNKGIAVFIACVTEQKDTNPDFYGIFLMNRDCLSI
jgi:hypothetical protein